jgi:transcriptional regulator with XRE-family HTH domain
MENNTIVLNKKNTKVLEIYTVLVLNNAVKLSNRLSVARKYAKLSQEELALAVGLTQGLISKIERGDQEETAAIVKIARVCGVRAEWLDDGSGEMIDGLYVENGKIKNAVLILQQLPEDALDEAIKGLDSVSKLIKMAR